MEYQLKQIENIKAGLQRIEKLVNRLVKENAALRAEVTELEGAVRYYRDVYIEVIGKPPQEYKS